MSAKIWAFYNREYSIIGPENKQMTSGISQNLMFLQENNFNLGFLADLIRISKQDIKYTIKSIDVLTYSDRTFKFSTTEHEKLAIINKKLTDTSGKKLQFSKSIFQDVVLSEEKNNLLRVIEVNFSDINTALDKVISAQVLSRSKIVRITPQEVFTDIADSYAYEQIINTIPYNFFYTAYTGKACDFGRLDTTIIQGTEQDFGIEPIPYETAIVYFPEERYQFSKIVKRNGICYAEITGLVDMPIEKLNRAEVIKNSRLVKTPITEFPNIVQLGRFAEWNPDIRIQNIVERSSNKTIMHKIWQDQKEYTGKYFDFTQDLKLVQENIKELSLLMNAKTFSLLEKINWKRHKEQHKLDINQVHDELIGIYQYWLSICLNLGVSFEEFTDIYNKKMKKLLQK